MEKERLETLAHIAGRLNAEKTTWCAGGSFMLDSRGILRGFRDIDIIVSENHAARADGILSQMGARASGGASDIFASEFYRGYAIDGLNVDLIAGFTIRIHGASYRYIFDEQSIAGGIVLYGENIPLAAPEDWFVLYLMIPGKEDKADAIGKHLAINGIARPGLLRRARLQALPRYIREAIDGLTLRAGEKPE